MMASGSRLSSTDPMDVWAGFVVTGTLCWSSSWTNWGS